MSVRPGQAHPAYLARRSRPPSAARGEVGGGHVDDSRYPPSEPPPAPRGEDARSHSASRGYRLGKDPEAGHGVQHHQKRGETGFPPTPFRKERLGSRLEKRLIRPE